MMFLFYSRKEHCIHYTKKRLSYQIKHQDILNNEDNVNCYTWATVTHQTPENNKSRSEPGNAPRIGFGHREVVC